MQLGQWLAVNLTADTQLTDVQAMHILAVIPWMCGYISLQDVLFEQLKVLWLQNDIWHLSLCVAYIGMYQLFSTFIESFSVIFCLLVCLSLDVIFRYIYRTREARSVEVTVEHETKKTQFQTNGKCVLEILLGMIIVLLYIIGLIS